MTFDLLRRRSEQPEPHGKRLPYGQRLVQGWPVFTYGSVPHVDIQSWRFIISGLVEESITFAWEEFLALPQVTSVSDMHCVTHWSRFDNRWDGVAFRELMKHVRPKPEARYVMVQCYGGYTTNLTLDDLMREGVLFAHSHDGQPLQPQHGAPLRLVVPHLYFWKSAKWVRGLVFVDQERPGFWEMHGYHMRGDPWREERYS